MITAEQIMQGLLPTTSKEFDVPSVGKILLHRLPANEESNAQKLFSNKEADHQELEELAIRNTYYMLHGNFDEDAAKKLPFLMDTNQLAMIHSTGMFFTNLQQENLEAIEKN